MSEVEKVVLLKTLVNLEPLVESKDEADANEIYDNLLTEIADELESMGVREINAIEREVIPCDVTFVPQLRFRVRGVFSS